MYDLDPIYICPRCGYETANPEYVYGSDTPFCPVCDCSVMDDFYTCPGCGKTKPVDAMLIDDIDLCKQCLRDIVGDLKKQYTTPRWKELIKYLEEVR